MPGVRHRDLRLSALCRQRPAPDLGSCEGGTRRNHVRQVECWFSQLKFKNPNASAVKREGRGGLGQAEVAVMQSAAGGALAARMRLWRLWRRFAEAYLNGSLLRQLSVCLRLLLKLLLERPIFRFVGHPLNPMACSRYSASIFMFMARHLRRLLRYPVHAHNQPTPSGPVRRTYLPDTRNQSRFAFGSTDSGQLLFHYSVGVAWSSSGQARTTCCRSQSLGTRRE